MKSPAIDMIVSQFTRCSSDWGKHFRGPKPFYRAYFPVSGHAKIILDDDEHTMSSGKAYFMDVHRETTHWTEDHFDIYWMHFVSLTPEIDAALHSVPAFFEWSPAWVGSRKRSIETLKIPVAKQSAADTARIHSLLLSMIADLLDLQDASSPAPLPEDIRIAIAYMDATLDEHPSLQAIADRVNLSPNYFHHRFRERVGITPHEYMLKRRMNAARRMVLTTDMTVQNISEQLGYNSPFYFSRVFSRFFHISPAQMRKTHQP